jgi:hypothetical protein
MNQGGLHLRIDFPWLPLTVLNPRDFTDHHLLYHLALIPFTFGDLRLGAKAAALVFAALAILATYLLMARLKVRYALFWLLALLGSAEWFIGRLSMTRRQSLSLLLLMAATYLLIHGRYRWMLVVAFAYAWLFDGFVLLVGIVGVAFIARDVAGWRWSPALVLRLALLALAATLTYFWREEAFLLLVAVTGLVYGVSRLVVARSWAWPLLGWTGAGLALALLVNPYYPNNVTFTILHVLPKLVPPADIRVGNEWYPYTPSLLLKTSWLALLFVPVGMLPLLLQPRRALRDRTVLFLVGLALLFLALYLRSRRFVEVEPAFAVLLCSYAWVHYGLPAARLAVIDRLPGRAQAGLLLFAAVLLGVGLNDWLRQAGVSTIAGLAALLQKQASVNTIAGLAVLLLFGYVWVHYRLSWARLAALDRLPERAQVALALGALVLLGVQLNETLRRAESNAIDNHPWNTFKEPAELIAANSEAGDRIFQTDWDDFPELFFFNSYNTYMIGLDPTYMYLQNPNLYLLWRSIGRGEVAMPAEAIRDRFGARWVVSDKSHPDFVKQAERDPDLEIVYESVGALVYRVKGP